MYKIEVDKKYEKFLKTPSYSERFSKLLNSNKKNVIYIKEEFEPSTFRYRAYNVEETMRDNDKYLVSYFLTSEIPNLYELIDKIDIVIFQRAVWTYEIDSFITLLKDNHKKIAFDIDDSIYKSKYIPSYLNNIGDADEIKFEKYLAYSERINMVLEQSDYIITTNDYLKDRLVSDYHKKVYVFHNYLNKEQEDVSKRIRDIKDSKYDDSKFVIGYFSGSHSHKRDLELVENALLELLKKYDDIYFLIVGLMSLSEELVKYQKMGRIIFDPYVPFEELQFNIANVDVNIIPLQNIGYNECKSELKYFESSVVKTPTVATKNTTYKEVIKDKVDGYLCEENEWFDTLEYIYKHRKESMEVASKACDKCLDMYGYKNQVKIIEKIYDDILKH